MIFRGVLRKEVITPQLLIYAYRSIPNKEIQASILKITENATRNDSKE